MSNLTNINFNLKVQSHLFIGDKQFAKNQIHEILRKIFCDNKCNNCKDCIQLKNNIHPNILSLTPEKQYNLEQIDEILKKISHKLENNEKFFIILNEADKLTQSCSNRLLKSIEEPSTGYYFIFLTEQKEAILPTIRSRCVLTYIDSDQNLNDLQEKSLMNFFINKNYDPINFLKYLDKKQINESECLNLIDNLIAYWSNLCKTNLIHNNKKEFEINNKTLAILNQNIQTLPMPGSSKIFLKNLFLQINNV